MKGPAPVVYQDQIDWVFAWAGGKHAAEFGLVMEVFPVIAGHLLLRHRRHAEAFAEILRRSGRRLNSKVGTDADIAPCELGQGATGNVAGLEPEGEIEKRLENLHFALQGFGLENTAEKAIEQLNLSGALDGSLRPGGDRAQCGGHENLEARQANLPCRALIVSGADEEDERKFPGALYCRASVLPMDGVEPDMSGRLALTLFLLLSTEASSVAAPTGRQTWIRLQTNHFDLLTDNEEQDARRTLQTLEETRWFFQQTTSLIPAAGKPLRIIALRSKEEYTPFRLQSTSFAHYLHSERGDYIVLQDIRPEHREAAVHEYTHFVFRMAGLKLPIWLCEGTADFYSSVVTQGGTALVGGLLPARMRSLRDGVSLPLETLVAADRKSPLYNEREKVSLFYAQSWALVHMLAFDAAYGPGFSKFLATVSNGALSERAFLEVYGKTLDQVEEDLREYVPTLGDRHATATIQSAPVIAAERVELSVIESELALAELLAAHHATAPRAKEALAAVNQQDPGNRQAGELLAYLATLESSTR